MTKKYYIHLNEGFWGVRVSINNGALDYEITAFPTEKQAEEKKQQLEGAK